MRPHGRRLLERERAEHGAVRVEDHVYQLAIERQLEALLGRAHAQHLARDAAARGVELDRDRHVEQRDQLGGGLDLAHDERQRPVGRGLELDLVLGVPRAVDPLLEEALDVAPGRVEHRARRSRRS